MLVASLEKAINVHGIERLFLDLFVVLLKKIGVCVSVNQIVSGQLELIPQGFGHLTGQLIQEATAFVDHHAGFCYIRLMKNLDDNNTLIDKHFFERNANTCGVVIKVYCSDKDRFVDTRLKEDCLPQQQNLTFCSVGVHHQNRIAQQDTCDLTEVS